MKTIRRDALSLDDVSVEWSGRDRTNGSVLDPSGDSVFIAVVPWGTKPADPDWHQGTWVHDTVNSRYYAVLPVGPGAASGVTLVLGNRYDVYSKLNDNPLTPVEPVGVIVAT